MANILDNLTCPVCGSKELKIFLERKSVPVQQNFLTPSLEKALNVPRGDLKMTFCQNCGFVFNSAFDPSLMEYDEDYDNTQESSSYFLDHLNNLKNKLIKEKDLTNSVIAEIGCGKGFFLKMLVLDEQVNNKGFGFDPSYEGELELENGKLRFEQKYFDGSCQGFKADALVCRHVIEHIPQPKAFLSEIKAALKESPGTRLFFETPCVNWIFETKTFWDFFYEHCSIFTAESLAYLFRKTGFKVGFVGHVFQGQYLWLEAENSANIDEIKSIEVNADLIEEFSKFESQMVEKWRKTIKKLSENGKVAVWGAGAKGVTFVNLVDPEAKLVETLVDLSQNKQGKYVPGTGHPVSSYKNLEKLGVKNVIVMNPNYYDENVQLLKKAGMEINLICEPGEEL